MNIKKNDSRGRYFVISFSFKKWKNKIRFQMNYIFSTDLKMSVLSKNIDG